jgi:hypothetical protein
MKRIRLEETSARNEFALRAARAFSKNPNLSTYTDKEIEAGCYFAIRWGFSEDCVVVIKVSDDIDDEPVNYINIIGSEEKI